MGAVPSQLLGRQHLFQSTMKAFAAAALVATASAAPEAKPWLVHPAAIPAVLPGDLTAHATSGELGTLPNGAQVPDTTLSVKAAAADHLAAKSATYAAHGLWGYGLPVAGHLWKRDTEAKPEADAWYGLGLGYTGYGPAVLFGDLTAHATSGDLVTLPNGAQVPDPALSVKAAAADHLAAKSAAYAAHGLWGYGKRSADADAKPYYGLGYGYAGYSYAPTALVAHPNGAVTPPFTLAQQVAAADHFAAK